MTVISRSAITITRKKPFIDWHNALFPDSPLSENTVDESKTYLIDELVNNADKAIIKYYKQIFEAELEGICIDENEWPANRNAKLFHQWFGYQISDWVMDLGRKDMRSE